MGHLAALSSLTLMGTHHPGTGAVCACRIPPCGEWSHTGCPVAPGSSSSFTAAPCSPVLFIQFILPLELSALYHTVIPQHQTSGDLLMELSGQVLEKQRCVPHGSWLQERKGDQTFSRPGMVVMRKNPVQKMRRPQEPTTPKMQGQDDAVVTENAHEPETGIGGKGASTLRKKPERAQQRSS